MGARMGDLPKPMMDVAGRPLLAKRFLVMYGDTLVDVDLDRRAALRAVAVTNQPVLARGELTEDGLPSRRRDVSGPHARPRRRRADNNCRSPLS